jgi:carbon-monoxide dehydrogenase large subunit
MTVSGAAKVPFPNRRMLAAMLDLPEASIRMLEYDVGGGFGARGEFYPEDFLIPFAARLTGAPVKWIEDRRENLLATNHARDAECELEIACARDGTILGLRGQAFTDLGAYLRTVGATASRNIAQVMSGPYRIPNIHVDVALLMTNKTPSGTYRGPGRFEADFFRERRASSASTRWRSAATISSAKPRCRIGWPRSWCSTSRPSATAATTAAPSTVAWPRSAGPPRRRCKGG